MPKKFCFRPLKEWVIHQNFGENKACIPLNGGAVITCDGNNPPPGYKSLYGPGGHNGLDLRAARWTRTYNIYDGRVIDKSTTLQRGLGAMILHEPWPGVFFASKHWHLIGMDVDIGDVVSLGALIGYCDNTGFSSGDHLHFELGTCDAAGQNYTPVDPLLYMYPTFALDAATAITKIREALALIADQLADYARNR